MQVNAEIYRPRSGSASWHRVATPILVFALLAAILSGCGVESMPVREADQNGDAEQVYNGQILSSEGSPQSGIRITCLQTGDSALSDQDGIFELLTSALSGQVDFLLERSDLNLIVSTESFPEDDGQISIRIELNASLSQGQLTISVESVDDGTQNPDNPTDPAQPDDESDPNQSAGPFDVNGNTTSFGIPSGLRGNIDRGKRVWDRNCSGCHGSRVREPGDSYADVRRKQGLPQHVDNSLSRQDMADLTAMLNKNSR